MATAGIGPTSGGGWLNFASNAIPVLGSLAGGLFGKKKKGPGPYDIMARQYKFARDMGLHPLAVLGNSGVSGQYGDGGSFGSGDTSFLGDAAYAAGNALRERADSRERAKDRNVQSRLNAKQMELIDAEIMEARSRTLLNQANVKRLLGPSPAVSGAAGGLETLDNRPVKMDPARNLAARQQVTLGDSTATGLNPEAFEIGLSELVAGGLIYGPQWAYDYVDRLMPKKPARKADPSRKAHPWSYYDR